MNADFSANIDEVLRIIETAEVFSILFPMIRYSLVVDTRTNAEIGPMVKVLPMTRSAEERIGSIHRLRPQFPRPDRTTAIPWPKYVSSLISLGVGDALARRLSAAGGAKAIREFRLAIQQLARLEKVEMVQVIKGENYHTIWSRKQ